MKKLTNSLLSILIAITIFITLFVISLLDWKNDWLILLAFLFFLILLVISRFSIEKFILLLIILLPISFNYNDKVINLADLFPWLKYYNLNLTFSAIILIYLIFLGFLTIFTHWEKVKKIPLKNLLLFYSLYMIISLFWSDYLGDSLVGLVYFLPPLAIYIIAFCYFSGKEGLLKILLASLASSLVPVFITLYQIIHKQYFFSPDSNLGRLQGPFNHPNLLGLHIFVIIALFISYYLAKEDKKISHNLFIILYNLILLAILVLTYSRVSWACLGLFLLILVYIRRNLIALFIAFSPVAAILAISIKNIRLRIIETFSGSLFSSWSARLNIWKISFSEIVKRPIFGNGIGTSEKIIEQAKSWQGGTIRPHNDLVLYGLELGIIGIIIFFAYTIGIIYYCRKTFICLNNKYETVQIYNKKFIINFKILSFGIMAIFLSLLLANGFEAISRRIVTQIVVWAILGCLFSLKISEKKYAK